MKEERTEQVGPELAVAAADIDEESEEQETVIRGMDVNANKDTIDATDAIPELSVPAADIEDDVMEKETKPLNVEGDADSGRCTNLSCLLNIALDRVQEIVSK